ncbi:MAG: iron chaperone [Thermomicrobiales bacterium]
MQSAAENVDAYLAEVPPERREVLTAIRQLCLENLPGYVEGMEYGMPSYARNGTVEVAFASQKKYISIYGLKSDVLEAHRAEFPGASIGKGCIRYTRPERIDLGAVERLLKATAASDGEVC